MLVEDLSDHVGDLLRASEEEQRWAADAERAVRAQVSGATAWQLEARRRKPMWKRLLFVPSAEEQEARRQLAAAQRWRQDVQARRLQLSREARQQAAGAEGEDALATSLSTRLSDDWLMLRGYQNRRGEADVVLVGPQGIWVVEVKNRHIRLNADGGDWRYETMDRRGNFIDHGSATDNSGRSWGRQAADVAADLVRQLESDFRRIPTFSAVVLVHPRASLGVIRNPGVDLITTDPEELVRAMAGASPAVSPDARRAVADLIRRDHHVQQERRSRQD